MNRFALIQLSDLQFGPNHVFGSPSDFSRRLAEDVLRMADKYSFTPMYILLSGDITETAHADEFAEAARHVDILCNMLSVDTASVVVVPGNHDVNWKLAGISGDIGDPYLKFHNYKNFLSQLHVDSILHVADRYPIVSDRRLAIDFILLNSCEEESDKCHTGFVDREKLLRSLATYKPEFPR